MAEIVVVGAGVVGAATARALARRGRRVALIERFGFGAAEGSSRGTSRIRALVPNPTLEYLELGRAAARLWAELEAEVGEGLVHRTGCLSLGPSVEAYAADLAAAGVDCELLDPPEVGRRFGVRVPAGDTALFQPEAGVIAADRALAALLRSARAAGAELVEGVRVFAVEPTGDGAELRTAAGVWRCDQVVVTAGPWTRRLLADAGVPLPLAVSRQSVAYFALPGGPPPPAVIDYRGAGPYALWDPARGLKAALHQAGPPAEPDGDGDGDGPPPQQVDSDALARTVDWARATFPSVVGGPAATESCLYTNAPEDRFLLERHGPVVVGSACSGRGFQFAPATAERLAALASAPPP
jgi:sarcosine oxidase